MQSKKSYHKFDGQCAYFGVTELAYLLNPEQPYSRTQVGRWVKKGMPYELNGKERIFNYTEVYKWLSENERDLDYLKAEQIRVQTENARKQIEQRELKIKETKKELVSIEQISQSQAGLIELLKSKDRLSVTRETDAKLKKKLDEHYALKWLEIQQELEILSDNNA